MLETPNGCGSRCRPSWGKSRILLTCRHHWLLTSCQSSSETRLSPFRLRLMRLIHRHSLSMLENGSLRSMNARLMKYASPCLIAQWRHVHSTLYHWHSTGVCWCVLPFIWGMCNASLREGFLLPICEATNDLLMLLMDAINFF